jgi:hypothetical protein
MDTTASLVCRAFLLKCPPEKREVLLSYLSDNDQAQMYSLPPTFEDPTEGIAKAEEQLEKIHFSWFSPFLRSLSELEIKLFVASLSQTQSEGLKKQLLFSNQMPAPSQNVKGFLQGVLLEKVKDPEVLPVECIADSPLNVLLSLKESQWRLLIDLLGIHDLSADLRLIIETAKLKRIQSLLSKPQLQYLKAISQNKEPLTFGRMSLEKWDGKQESLHNLVQHRGLNRLAKALYEEDPSLFWHFSHKLDMESAAILKKLAVPLENRRALAYLSDQIIQVISYIQNPSAPENR